METFVNFLIPFLKFTAIFIAGASGILALLVDFKTDGKITKWGRIALISTITSFVISATMQAIELHRDKMASIAETRKTNSILNSISRGIYKIDQAEMSFDVVAKIKLNDKIFSHYKKRILNAIVLLEKHSGLKLQGTGIITDTDISDNVTFISAVTISPSSPLYPNKVSEAEVFKLLGEISLDITIKKYDTVKKRLNPKKSFEFYTEFVNPQLTYNSEDTSLEIRGSGLKPEKESYAWLNQGDIESLTDLSRSKVTFSYSDALIDGLSDEATNVYKRSTITSFSFNVCNRKFSTFNPCPEFFNGFPGYYILIPKDIFKTQLNIRCDTPP